MFLTAIKARAKLIMFGLLVSVAFAAWYVYNDMSTTIQRQASELATQNIEIQHANIIMLQAKTDARKQREINNGINKKFANTRSEVEKLRKRFNKLGNSSRVTRDIGKLAIGRPKLVQKIINNGTAEALRCVEIISGSELTESEISAERKSQINSLCYEIANPSYIDH